MSVCADANKILHNGYEEKICKCSSSRHESLCSRSRYSSQCIRNTAQESAVEDTSDAELEAIMREAEAAAAGADGTEESGSDGSATEETKYAAKLTEVVETLEQKVSAGGSAMSKEDVSILKSFFESISPEDNFATVSDFLSFVLSSYSDQGIDGDDSHAVSYTHLTLPTT